jgi:hypothetical protein
VQIIFTQTQNNFHIRNVEAIAQEVIERLALKRVGIREDKFLKLIADQNGEEVAELVLAKFVEEILGVGCWVLGRGRWGR